LKLLPGTNIGLPDGAMIRRKAFCPLAGKSEKNEKKRGVMKLPALVE